MFVCIQTHFSPLARRFFLPFWILFHFTTEEHQRMALIEFIGFRLAFDFISFVSVFFLFVLFSDNWSKAVVLTSEVNKTRTHAHACIHTHAHACPHMHTHARTHAKCIHHIHYINYIVCSFHLFRFFSSCLCCFLIIGGVTS